MPVQVITKEQFFWEVNRRAELCWKKGGEFFAKVTDKGGNRQVTIEGGDIFRGREKTKDDGENE